MSRIPNFYRPMFEGGPRGPLRWQDDVSGILPAAMLAFFEDKGMNPDQFYLVREYGQYYINAPCWDWNPHLDEEGKAELAALRERIKAVRSKHELMAWVDACLDMGIDPLSTRFRSIEENKMDQVLFSKDGLAMLMSAAGAFFSIAYTAHITGKPDAPSKEDLQALQVALREGLTALGQEASPTLQRVLDVTV